MEGGALVQFKDLGAIMVLGLAALGSAAGAGIAGMSAIGAWKKNFSQNKPASFLLVALTAAPLTQTIYGFIVMNRMLTLVLSNQYLWGIGLLSGAAIVLSALWQGKSAAAACTLVSRSSRIKERSSPIPFVPKTSSRTCAIVES